VAIEVIYYFVLLCLSLVSLIAATLLVLAARHIGQQDMAIKQMSNAEELDGLQEDETAGI